MKNDHRKTAEDVMETTGVLDEIGRQLAVLRDAKRRFSPQLAPDFRLFDYVRGNEVGVSRIIGDLLNPDGSHGQKDVFLNDFLQLIDSGGWANSAAVKAIQVEKPIGLNGRLDIYIQFDDGHIAIENKPWAADGEEQLSRYADFLESSKGMKNWKLVYLSNSDPEEHSISSKRLEEVEKGGNFVQLGYGELAEWLSRCAARTRSPRVRFFIEEFIQFVEESINGKLGMIEEKEVIDAVLCSDDPKGIRLSAAVALQASWKELKKRILRELEKELRAKIHNHSSYAGWHLEAFNEDFLEGRPENGFSIDLGLGQNRSLSFVFGRGGHDQFYWGISADNSVRQGSGDRNEAIRERMNRLFTGAGNSNRWWAWYAYADQAGFGPKFLNWSTSDEPWIAIRNGQFAERLLEVATAVYDEFKNDLDLLER